MFSEASHLALNLIQIEDPFSFILETPTSLRQSMRSTLLNTRVSHKPTSLGQRSRLASCLQGRQHVVNFLPPMVPKW